ncbi:MAG: co-chaperone GroES [Planctomycetota bacterium]|jgi:chaperonin GroES
MKLKPLGDHVVVKPIEAEEKTAGGIVLPDTAKEKQTQGTVVAVGSGRILPNGRVVKLIVKKGDKVIYGKYSGSDIDVEGETYKICSESEILALIEKK